MPLKKYFGDLVSGKVKYELQSQIHALRGQIHELPGQICELRVPIYELRVQNHQSED